MLLTRTIAGMKLKRTNIQLKHGAQIVGKLENQYVKKL